MCLAFLHQDCIMFNQISHFECTKEIQAVVWEDSTPAAFPATSSAGCPPKNKQPFALGLPRLLKITNGGKLNAKNHPQNNSQNQNFDGWD